MKILSFVLEVPETNIGQETVYLGCCFDMSLRKLGEANSIERVSSAVRYRNYIRLEP